MARLEWHINKDIYDKIRDRIGDQREHPPQYDLIDYNCCSFAVEIVRRAGIPLEPPETFRGDFGVFNDDQRPNYRPDGVASAIRKFPDGTLFGE